MTGTTTVPGGARRPGPAPDGGAVSVEAAYAIAGLVLVTMLLAWTLALLGSELALASASRAAARVAARGQSVDDVVTEAHRLVPEAVVSVRDDGGHVVVECRRSITPPGPLARLGSVRLEARSAAVVERP